jgi:hypothetical protein
VKREAVSWKRSDYIFFLFIAISAITVMIESSVIRIAGFTSGPDLDRDMALFMSLFLSYVITVVVTFMTIKKRASLLLPSRKKDQQIFLILISAVHALIIISITLLIAQSIYFLSYSSLLLKLVFNLTYACSLFFFILLFRRFIIWYSSNRNLVTLFYTAVAAILVTNVLFSIAYTNYETDLVTMNLSDIKPRPFYGFVMHVPGGNPIAAEGYFVTSIILFVLTWIATVFFLRDHSKRIGTVKYWIIVSIPLVYFISQYQTVFLDLFQEYRLSDPIGYNIWKTIILNINKPVGGILFSIAFIQLSRAVKNEKVRNYLILSAAGLVLIFTSNQAELLISANFPPFGLISISYLPLASYLFFTGIFASAVSVSRDEKIRSQIRKSIEPELNFLSRISSTELNRSIMARAENILKKTSEVGDEPQIESSLTREDITQYIREIIDLGKGQKKSQ